jgi:uncharacterized protein
MSDVTTNVTAAPAATAPAVIRKTLDVRAVRDFKKLGDGAGGFSGYANPFGQLDSVGDITMPGAFTSAIPGFLTDGFIPLDHAWGIATTAGFPRTATEDDYGLFIEVAFHSTALAQDARTIVFERLDAGLTVKLSIGFTIADFEYVSGADAVQYLINPTADEIAACVARARVRLIKAVDTLYEVSLVSVPAAAGSDVIGVKNSDGSSSQSTESKGVHLGDNVEESLSIRAVEMLHERLMWRVLYDMLYDAGDTPVQARLDIIDEAMTEMKEAVMRIIGALLNSKGPGLDAAKADLAALLETKNATAPPVERKVAAECDDALAAVTTLHTRLVEIDRIRTKAGRRISRATRELLQPHSPALRAAADTIDALLADAEGDGDAEAVTMLGKSAADATDNAQSADVAAETGAETDTATADEPVTADAGNASSGNAESVYADPEIANGILAQFIIEHGDITNE